MIRDYFQNTPQAMSQKDGAIVIDLDDIEQVLNYQRKRRNERVRLERQNKEEAPAVETNPFTVMLTRN